MRERQLRASAQTDPRTPPQSRCEARAVHTFRSAYHHLLAPAATHGITMAASWRSSTWGSVRGLLISTGAGMNAIAAIAWSVGIALTGYLWARHLYSHRRGRWGHVSNRDSRRGPLTWG